MADELKDPPPSKKMRRAGRILNYLVTRWATPGAGRGGGWSPLVGLVAGLGAVAFLILLRGMIHLTFGVLLGFHPPPTGEEVQPPGADRAGPASAAGGARATVVSESGSLEPYRPDRPGPWWLVLLIP